MVVRWRDEDWVIRKINLSSDGHEYSLNLDRALKPFETRVKHRQVVTTCVSPREVTKVLCACGHEPDPAYR